MKDKNAVALEQARISALTTEGLFNTRQHIVNVINLRAWNVVRSFGWRPYSLEDIEVTLESKIAGEQFVRVRATFEQDHRSFEQTFNISLEAFDRLAGVEQ